MALLLLTACFPDKPQAGHSDETKESGAESLHSPSSRSPNSDASKTANDSVVVELGVIKGSNQAASVFSLVSVFDQVVYRLSGCMSGNNNVVTTGSSTTRTLYKFDQSCVISIDRVRIAGVDFSLPVAENFNTSVNATNTLQSSTGKLIFIKVVSQLPSILTDPSYSVSFIASETIQGVDQTVPIYEVGISVDRTEITEGSGLYASFTVRRAVPAIGALLVNLFVSGTATAGVDTSTIPLTLTFADGQSQREFVVSVVDDNFNEALESLSIGIGAGAYLAKAPAASFNIKDDDVAVLQCSPATLSFGSRALNLPHSLTATLSNSGKAPATQLQLLSGLAAPFYFPAGYPGEGGTCGISLGVGQSCTMTFGFNPTTLGASSTALLLSYANGVDTSTVSLNLQGTGANTGYLVLGSGSRFDFGAQSVATTVKEFVVVSNPGLGNLSALSGSFSSTRFSFFGGTFPGTGGNCSTSIAAGATCTIVLAFTPNSTGAFVGTFMLNYNNGTQVLSAATSLEGTASNLLATSETLSTGLNQALALQLKSSGATGAVSYAVLQTPRFGSLSGTAPNLIYTPSSGFNRVDSFTFRATDSLGPSAAAEIQIFVRPKAVFLVSNPASLVVMDTRMKFQLESLGFVVTLVDDGLSSSNQAIGQDLVAVSASVTPNSVLTKYRDVRLPVVLWEKGLYDDMKLVSASNMFGTTPRVSAINIVNNSSVITQGLALGSQTVFTNSARINYVFNTDVNMEKFATVVGANNQTTLFGYEADSWMPGSLIAPARRLGAFFPNADGDFTSTGLSLINSSIKWLMQNKNHLVYDSFQRDASTILGNGWQETESTASAFSLNGQELLMLTDDNFSFATNRFALQTGGILTMRYYLNMQRTGSLGTDYLVAMQLGRCDLMDRNVTNESGVAVNILWGGVSAGMASESSLAYRQANGTTVTLGTLNSGNSFIEVETDLTNRSYRVTSALGTSTAIPFQNNVALDCVRLVSKNINSNSFTQRGIHKLRLFQGN